MSLRKRRGGKGEEGDDGLLGRRRERAPYMLGAYALFALAFALAVAATLLLEGNSVVQRFGPNVATEVLGIVVTLAFVQRLLAREERARKLRAAVGALRKGRVALGQLIGTWTVLTKGALDARRTEYPRRAEQLFASYYTEELACLNPLLRVEREGETATWLALAAERLAEAQHRLRDVILTYGAALDPDYLEAVDELADDPFVAMIIELASQPSLTPQQWRVGINQSRGHREAHFVRLNYAIEVHNALAEEAARFRSQHLAPRAQSLSIELGSDRDLRVQTQLDASWWRAEPAVGVLRS